MSYLIDSHVLLWAASDERKLSVAAKELIEDPRVRLALSVASMWELTFKFMRGRLRLPEPVEHYLDGLVRDFDLEVLPIHAHHVAVLADLPGINTDPFDRMLIAQALSEDIPLITADEQLRAYPVETIW